MAPTLWMRKLSRSHRMECSRSPSNFRIHTSPARGPAGGRGLVIVWATPGSWSFLPVTRLSEPQFPSCEGWHRCPGREDRRQHAEVLASTGFTAETGSASIFQEETLFQTRGQSIVDALAAGPEPN